MTYEAISDSLIFVKEGGERRLGKISEGIMVKIFLNLDKKLTHKFKNFSETQAA